MSATSKEPSSPRILGEMIVTCPACQAESPLSECKAERQVGVDAWEVGIRCPQCKHWTHARYRTRALDAAHQRLQYAAKRLEAARGTPRFERRYEQYQTQLAAFKRLDEQEQKRWRQKRGGQSPTAVLEREAQAQKADNSL